MDSTAPVDDLAIAQRRAENLASHGGTVVSFSQQAAAAGLSVLWAVMVATRTSSPGNLAWLLLAGAGTAICVLSWVRARLARTLLPYRVEEPERPLVVLRKKQRVEIAKQIRGQESTTPLTAPLVRGILLWQRRSTRIALPTLIGMGLGLIGLGGSTIQTGQVWSFAVFGAELAAVFIIAVVAVVEACRRHRVLTTIEASYQADS